MHRHGAGEGGERRQGTKTSASKTAKNTQTQFLLSKADGLQRQRRHALSLTVRVLGELQISIQGTFTIPNGKTLGPPYGVGQENFSEPSFTCTIKLLKRDTTNTTPQTITTSIPVNGHERTQTCSPLQ